MYKLILFLFLPTFLFASLDNIKSFDADFTQTITDENNKTLVYQGHVIALKPQNALWRYVSPVEKSVYINSFNVIIVEPEIEQAIIKRLNSSFDFFNMIKSAKHVDDNIYTTLYKNKVFVITVEKNNVISSISYIDEFENDVEIAFTNQKNNKNLNKAIFFPSIPREFDIIRD